MESKTNDKVIAKFIKQKHQQLQFIVGNKSVNVSYGGNLSKRFRKAVRKQFKKQPFSLPQNINSFEGMGINRAGNIVEFSKVAKKFQHNQKQNFRVYQIIGETEDIPPMLILKHLPKQDFHTTITYVTKNGKNDRGKRYNEIQKVIKNFFWVQSGSQNRLIVKPYKNKVVKIKPMYHPALPSTIKGGPTLIPDSKDVDFDQSWNTKTGSCFYDYLLHLYGTPMSNGKWNNKVPKELRLLVQDRKLLWEVMTNIFDFEGEHIADDWSVNVNMISNLCTRYEVSCYLINEADEFIFTYQNKHPKQKKIPPIYAMITNQHINPIISDHKKKSLQHRLMGGKSKKEQKKKEPKQYEIVKVPFQTEDKIDMFDVLCQKSRETGKTPLPLGLKLDTYRVDGFILDDKKYIYDTEDNQMGEIYAKNIGVERWRGTGIKSVAIKMFEEEHYLKSQLTPDLYKLFTNQQVKDRTHRGFVNGTFQLNKDVLGFDINKAYTDCVMNPYDDWYIMGFDSVWENYDHKKKIINAFYYVETTDKMLFHGNNIYSKCIIEYGLNKKIITFENIKAILKPVKTQKRDRFKSLFDKYLNLCDVQPKSEKFVVGYKYYDHIDEWETDCVNMGTEYTCINIGEEEEEYLHEGWEKKGVLISREIKKSKRITFETKVGIQIFNLTDNINVSGEYYQFAQKLYKRDNNELLSVSCDGFSALDDGMNKKSKVGKFCCNLMTGLLGRKTKKKMLVRLSTNFQDVSQFYQDNEGSQIFCNSSSCNGKDIYIFGLKTETPLINNHLPNYIQILDNMNVRQYKMMKTFMKKEHFGVAPIYRKVDMFCCDKKYLKGNYQSKLSNDIGGYKLEIPKVLYSSSYKFRDFEFLINTQDDAIIATTWNDKTKKNDPINDSSQIEEIKEILFGSYKYTKTGKSLCSVNYQPSDVVLMVEGDGGTGKTKIITDLDKEYKCLKMSFTNKACININGTTYHRGLGLNKRLDITPSKFDNIEKEYDVIVCEEFSMNTSWIWNYICWLRELTTLPILLTGDWGQARPVEPDIKPKYDKYNLHPVIKNLLTDKIMLEKNYRAKDDLPFAKFLHDNKAHMENVNIDEFKLTDDKQSGHKQSGHKRFITKGLCYMNSTRKRINCEISEAVIKRQHISQNNIFEIGLDNIKQEKKVSFEVSWKDGVTYDDVNIKGEDKNPTQSIRVFTGTPMISRMTEKSGELLFNNEDFVIKQISYIKELDTQMVYLKSLNRKDDHPLYQIELKKLQSKFLVAWCLTTHKAQGQTIKEAFKIYDWDKMNTELRYTAMSRAQKRKNVFIEPLKLFYIGDELEDDTDWETDDDAPEWDEVVKKYEKPKK